MRKKIKSPKVFHSVNEWREYFLPNAYKKRIEEKKKKEKEEEKRRKFLEKNGLY